MISLKIRIIRDFEKWLELLNRKGVYICMTPETAVWKVLAAEQNTVCFPLRGEIMS